MGLRGFTALRVDESRLDDVEHRHAMVEAIDVDIVVLGIANRPPASTTKGALAMPRKPGPSLAPPMETKAGISSQGRFGPSSRLTTDPNDGWITVGLGTYEVCR